MASKTAEGGLKRYWPRLLLLIPFFAVLWVPFYNRLEPALGGVPFFYWYQLAWILIGALLVLVVYLIETRITHAIERTKILLDRTGAPGDILLVCIPPPRSSSSRCSCSSPGLVLSRRAGAKPTSICCMN